MPVSSKMRWVILESHSWLLIALFFKYWRFGLRLAVYCVSLSLIPRSSSADNLGMRLTNELPFSRIAHLTFKVENHSVRVLEKIMFEGEPLWFYTSKSVYRSWGAIQIMWKKKKVSVEASEGAMLNQMNRLQWCHLSQHWLGLRTTSLNIVKVCRDDADPNADTQRQKGKRTKRSFYDQLMV